MKKNNKNRLQKVITIGFIVLVQFFGLYAVIRETTWGDFLPDGIREDKNSGVYTAGRLAFDGNEETYWALESGKTEGYADRYFSEEKDIDGISADITLSEGSRLSVMREKDGVLLPYENGIVEGPFEGEKEITFSEDARATGHLVFKIEGEKADESRINEIRIKERSDSRQFGKIVPESYSFNQKEYINIKPERLWDGYVNETWYEPLWYIPWEIQQSNEGRSGIFPDFNGHPSKKAEIIWELDGVYKIEVLKAYFGADWRSAAFEFWNGEGWVSKTELGRNSGKGWFRKELTKTIETDRIRITFPDGWESARYINQIEVWGEGVFTNTERKVLFERDEGKGIYRASISGAYKDGFEADILTEGYDDKGVSLKINEDEKKEETPSYTNGKRSVYSLEVKDYEEREGTQFLEINTYGKKLENITIRKKEGNGRIKLGGSYTDKNREQSNKAETESYEKEFVLDRKYSLEKIRIYAEAESGLRVENAGGWNSFINCSYNERGYYEADLGGIQKNKLKISSDGKFNINEIELYGSPAEDKSVSIEIWSNQKNAGENSCLTGWIGNPVTLVTADGTINPRQADNLFWMPVRECGRNYLKKDRHEIKAELYGKTSVKKYRTKEINDTQRYGEEIKDSALALSIELPYDSIITQKESIVISGCTGNGDEIKVFINGNQVETESDFYQAEISLEEGENTVTVEAVDRTGRRREKTVRIIKDSTEPQIKIIEPAENQYINSGTAKFIADGKEEDLWWQFNEEEWERGYGRYKYKDYQIEDGFYTYSVRAQDRAGNISERKYVDFCMDKTLPESFEIKLNVEGWTNNNMPEAVFNTTDATSGIDHYEYKIDDNIWQVCESPLQIETLKDGKRMLYVRAIDKASNIREESVMIYVDTSCPPVPQNARPVPDEKSIFMKWTGADDNCISDDEIVVQEGNRSYRIEREPAWKAGSVKYLSDAGYGKLFFEDTEVKQGESYSYRMWAVDRAGNESEKTQWKSVIAGLSSVEIAEEGSTYAEFEGLTVSIPQDALSEDIIRIQINEVPWDVLTEDDRPLKPLLGGIYSVTAVRRNSAGEEYVTNHAELLEEAVLEIGYSRNLIPEGYDETQMSVFYYDDLWGSWLPMRDCYTDREKQVIRCKTNHFTEFSVQATKKTALSEAEVREGAYRLDGNRSGNQEINISGEDGGVSLNFQELYLPGKNSLDLSVSRTYSTGRANEDAATDEKADIDGGAIWKIADGWRINMPHMMWNGNSMVVYGTDGVCSSIGQMSEVKGYTLEDSNAILMESHEYANLKIKLKFDVSTRYFLWIIPVGKSYKFDGAVLYQSDGRRINYGRDGRVTSIEDQTGKNKIQFTYASDKITVTDSYGRTTEFIRSGGKISGIKSGGRKITYTTEGNKLTKATDAGGREWNYEYETKKLSGGSYEKDAKESEKDKNTKTREVCTLTGTYGPGVGYTKIDYRITEKITYDDEVESYGTKYKFAVFQDRLTASSKTVWKSFEDYEAKKEYLRKTDIGVLFAAPLEKNIYVEKSVIYDGRTTTVTEYGTVKKDRNRLSMAPEAIKRIANYSALAADSKDNIQILTYAKETKVYDGLSTDQKLIQKDKNEISEEFMKITRAESVKGVNRKTDEYVYEDKTGNLTEETHKTASGSSNVSADRTVRTYVEKNYMQLPETVKNLSWHAGSVEEDAAHEYETASYEKYEYNEYGQMIKASKGPDEKKLNTYEYSYQEGQKEDGLLKEIISPEFHHTNYSYSYNDDSYTTTVTYSGVEGLSGTETSVSETYVYDKQTGNLTEQTDRDGYITQNSYDKLGRITQIRKYHESGKKGEREKFTETTAVYDDAALTTTVTDGLGAVTVNTFDGLGRLIRVEKTGNTISDENIEAASKKTVTIKLEYDNYDRVTKMSEPSYEEPSLESDKFTGTTYSYDAQNRLLRKTDADNNVLENVYDDENGKVSQNVKKIADGAEVLEETKEVYKDYNGNVIKEVLYFTAHGENTDSAKTVSAMYDGKGRKVCVTEPYEIGEKKTEFSYDYLGNVSEVTYADGLKETNTYNKDGKLVKTERKGAAETSSAAYKVNALGYVTEETRPADNSKTVLVRRKYDGRGNVLSEAVSYKGDAADVRTITSVYDWMGNVTSQTDGEGNTTTYGYDSEGNLTSVTDPRHNVSSYRAEFRMKMEYDSFGRLIKGWLPQNEKRNSYTTADVYLVYDAQGNCTYRKENEGVETDYVYTKTGLLKEQITDGYETSYEYNGAGKLTKTVNPDGTWKASTYDKAGHLLFETISGNTAAVQYSYDKNGKVKTVTDRNGNVTEYEYDVMNRVVEESVAGLLNKKTAYDGLGRVKSETDGEDNCRIYEYDTLGRVVKETVNTVPETVLYYEYDARGNVTKFTDVAGTVFKRTYTKTDLLKEEKVYAKGNTSETPDETRKYEYDEAGALKSVSDASGTVYYNGVKSEYQPDAYGNTRREYWDKTRFEMSYDYDSLNRLTSVTTPDGKKESYSYNKNSQITAISGLINGTLSYNNTTKRLDSVNFECGINKNLTYNESGLVSEFSYSSDMNAALKTGFEYIYDKNFNITDRIHKDTKEKDTFTYDGLNRLVTSSLKGKFSNDTYEQFNLFNMKEIDRDIDGMASETKATLNGKLFPADKVTLDEKGKSFVYDFKEEKEIQKIELFKTNLEKTSRIRERDLHIYTKQNEDDGWTELTPDNWNYVVDPKNQSIHFNLKTSLKTRFIKIRTIWDDRDIDNNNVSDYVTFSNESVQKMIRIWTLENERNENYDYDRNSNRKIITENGKNRSYTYYKNDKNGNTARVMSDGKWYYTYDANGNRTARAVKAENENNKVTLDKTGEYWEYTWDYHNRLIKVAQHNAPDNAQNVVVEYEYDALNRRIERTSRTKAEAEVTQYAYGRNGAITYRKKENSGVSRTFAYLNNQITAFLDKSDDGTEKLYYTVTDIQGSVTEVYAEDGVLVWKSGYTAFGIKAGETTNLIDFDGLYTGCDYDAETGLTYHWNRWRSEDGDSWLSQDPSRDGMNWYGYAEQNPINWQDNTGLSTTLDDFAYQQRTENSPYKNNGYPSSTEGQQNPQIYRDSFKSEEAYASLNQGFTDVRNIAARLERFGQTEGLSRKVLKIIEKYPYISTMDLVRQYMNFNVTVSVLRPTDGLGKSFDSIRRVYLSDRYGNIVKVYEDWCGANSKVKNNEDFTIPDGVYYCTTDRLIDSGFGIFDSYSYKNTYRLQTKDSFIDKTIRDKINDGNFQLHANQFARMYYYDNKGNLIERKCYSPYNNNMQSGSLGCIISQNGQSQHDLFMSYLRLSASPEDIRIRVYSKNL